MLHQQQKMKFGENSIAISLHHSYMRFLLEFSAIRNLKMKLQCYGSGTIIFWHKASQKSK